MPTLNWTTPTQSGLGDRLVDILTLLSLARLRGAALNVPWPPFRMEHWCAQHRQFDIHVDNVRRYLRFPPDLTFNAPGAFEPLRAPMGGDGNWQGFAAQHGLDVIRFREVLHATSREFSFCPEILQWRDGLPSMAGFHIRRTDKIAAADRYDGTNIVAKQLDELNALTYRAIDACAIDKIFFCTDDDRELVPFVQYAKARGHEVVTSPPMEKWQMTYYDLAALSHCQYVVTSMPYSSFSRFASMIGRGAIRTVYNAELTWVYLT